VAQTLRMFTVFVLLTTLLTAVVHAQSEDITAEAVGTANLRAATDVNALLLGEIANGSRYPVIGRSAFYPWLLLGDVNTRQPIGWVFQDLVIVAGNINNVPFIDLDLSTQPTLTPFVTTPLPNSQSDSVTTTATPQETAATSFGVYGTASGEINIRVGPGVEYPRVGVGQTGDRYEVTGYHTQYPWVQVSYPPSPNGLGWIARELLSFEGNTALLPPLSDLVLDFPTLTPTQSPVQTSLLMQSIGTPVPISPAFQTLGDQIWDLTLQSRFDPQTSRVAGFFLMNERTGETLSFGSEFAFSGMSVNKILIMVTLYSQLQVPPDEPTAINLANMMVCSENTASNALLATIGNGDAYQGGALLTSTMEQLGLGNTFMVAPFVIPGVPATPVPVRAPTTTADQVRAAPDYSNQMTVDEMGWLLNGLYQCAFNNSGPLMAGIPGAFDQRECRQMINIMSDNNLDQPLLMSAGVPDSVQVAHKHGWTADTHGNAGIAFTPNGAYVMVVALHNPEWIEFTDSFPLITEMSRLTYNYLNPEQPLEQAREYYVVETDECRVTADMIEMLRSFTA
jgi:uncharacterized protein YraI